MIYICGGVNEYGASTAEVSSFDVYRRQMQKTSSYLQVGDKFGGG